METSNIALVTGRANRELSEKIAKHLGISLLDEEIVQFYNQILDGEMRYFILVSFISSDNLYTKEDYESSLAKLKFIKKHLGEMTFHDGDKGFKEIRKYVNRGIRLLSTEYKEIIEKDIEDNGKD